MNTSSQREVISVDGLSMRYGDSGQIIALSELSLTLTGPQVIGVLGPNGAGKTTLLEILEGLREPTSGKVRLFGEPLDRRRYPRRRIGAVLQREPVLEFLTVRDYAALFAAIYRVPGGGPQIIGRARLEARADTPIDRLSGGEAQRLFIAAAIAHEPELLFLDEPTAHLDPENKAQIGVLVRELGKQRTVILCTHDLDEADKVCDSVVFLVGGRVQASGSRQELLDAMPEAAGRAGRERRLEDAFFHYCAASLTAAGELR